MAVALARLRERIDHLCASADARALRPELIRELRHALGFDAYVWLLTDPETSVGSAPLAEIPPALLPQLPTLVRLKYLTEINRWTALTGAASLHEATAGELSRSRSWRELLHRFDVTDVASVALRDRYGCWGFLDLWRTGRIFSVAETAALGDIATTVTAALRRAHAASFVESPAPPRGGPVVLLLAPELIVLGQTPQTEEYLRRLLPPDGEGAPVPAAAYNVAAQLLAVEAGVDSNPPYSRVALPDGSWLSLHAARIGDKSTEANIAVTLTEASPTERLGLFARVYALSPRETELLSHLAAGADTRELAQHMFLSEHTVQDHLKSIFAKAGTRSRRSLLARALGT